MESVLNDLNIDLGMQDSIDMQMELQLELVADGINGLMNNTNSQVNAFKIRMQEVQQSFNYTEMQILEGEIRSIIGTGKGNEHVFTDLAETLEDALGKNFDPSDLDLNFTMPDFS